MYTQKMNLYGAIWAKCPNVAYLEGRLKSNKYGIYVLLLRNVQMSHI